MMLGAVDGGVRHIPNFFTGGRGERETVAGVVTKRVRFSQSEKGLGVELSRRHVHWDVAPAEAWP